MRQLTPRSDHKKHLRSAWIAIMLSGAPIFPLHAHAMENCDSILYSEERAYHIRDLLADKKYDALETEMANRLSRIEKGIDNDESLRSDLTFAFYGDVAFEPLLTDWIYAYPKSYAARIARASYFYSVGTKKRGGKVADKTSEEQFREMRQEFRKAREDIQEATGLSKTPTLAYAQSFIIDRNEAGHAAVLREIRDAQAKFPKSLALRIAATYAIGPKWGGSVDEFEESLKAARDARLPDAEVKMMRYGIEMESAGFYEEMNQQPGRAREHYLIAASICSSAYPWYAAMRISKKSEDWEGLLVGANGLLAFRPTDVTGLENRGYANEKLNRIPASVPDYQAAADSGSSWAQNKLGYMYMLGQGVSKDAAKAKLYFEKAAAQGNKNAAANLIELGAAAGKNKGQ